MIKCLRCGRDGKGKDVCVCGSRNKVYGEKFNFTDGAIVCICGSTEYTMVMDYEIGGVWQGSYDCNSCGSALGVDRYI